MVRNYCFIAGVFMIMLLAIILPKAFAGVGKICIDNSTLEVNTTYEVKIDGNISTVETSKRVSCIYGCENSQCKEGSMLNKMTFPIFTGISILFVLLGILFNKWFFGFAGGSLLIVTGLILAVQGISFSETVTSNVLTQGIGVGVMLIAIYVTVLAGLGSRSRKIYY